MIAKLKHRRPIPKSQGPKGDLDSRRWVIITLRNNGANECQFPLPVTVNTQRIAFDRDEPVIAPAYYIDTIDSCVLPKYEKAPSKADGGNGQVRSEDDARMVELKYQADILEIDAKYQTPETIMDFVQLVNSDECPVELTEFNGRLRLGQASFNRLNYEWGEANTPKKGATKGASNNT